MLIGLKEILAIAEERKGAIAAFNMTNLEIIQAVVEAAEELGVPIILNHAPVHSYINNIETMSKIAIDLAKKSKVPICLNLDHGPSLDVVKKAINLGFTSVMFDGSSLSFDANVEATKEIVLYAHENNVTVEAELGHVMTNDNGKIILKSGSSNPKDFYTNPLEAEKFVKETNVDALAIAFGTIHGFYKEEPKLDFELIKEIRDKTNNLPLVMHGGSGIKDDEYKKAIAAGIRKINYYAYMAKAGYDAVEKECRTNQRGFYHDLVIAAKNAMKEDALRVLKIFWNL